MPCEAVVMSLPSDFAPTQMLWISGSNAKIIWNAIGKTVVTHLISAMCIILLGVPAIRSANHRTL